MVIFLIVGLCFSLFGLFFLYVRYHFEKEAREVSGFIVAIEKRISRARKGQARRVLYYPIIEYTFKGENFSFRSGGSSYALSQYKIGQKVKLLSLDHGPEYVMLKDGVIKIMAWIFTFIGLGLLGFGAYQIQDFQWNSFSGIFFGILPLGLFLGVVLVLAFLMRKHSKGKLATEMFKVATLVTQESLVGKDVYKVQKQIDAKLGKNRRLGLIVTFLFFAISYGFCSWMYNELPDENWRILLEKKNPKMMGLLFGLFMGGVSLLSLAKQLLQRK